MASDVVALFARLRELRQLYVSGSIWEAKEYWREYLRAFCAITQSSLPRLFRLDEGVWFVREALHFGDEHLLADESEKPLLEKAVRQSFALAERVAGVSTRRAYISLSPLEHVVLAIELSPEGQQRLSEVMVRAQLIADVPASWLQSADGEANGHDLHIQQDADWLRMMADIHAAKNFRIASSTWANNLVQKLASVELAAVGWRRGDYVRVEAVSHFEKFQKKTELIKNMEVAMEEASDQRGAILFGDGRTNDLASRAHKQLQTMLGCREILTVPVVGDHSSDEIVLMLVSFDQPLSNKFEAVVRYLGLTSLPRMGFLYQKRRGPLIGGLRSIGKFASFLLGRQHWMAKLVGLTTLLGILFLVLVDLPHRIEGDGRLMSRVSQVITAPYDGFIDDILVDSGDLVRKGDVLVTLDTQELLLQMAEVEAEIQRFQAERDAARAKRELVQVNINEAKITQTIARRARLQAYLEQSELRAPFDGVVVEGDRLELLSAPVKLGEQIFRIAELDTLFVRASVLEHDVVFLDEGMGGDFAFVSQPNTVYSVSLNLISPEAQFVDQRGNSFDVDVEFIDGAQPWWRPGMSGVVKLDAGDQPAWWVLSHRIIDRLRLFFWW